MISDKELAGTVKFAMKATKELNLSNPETRQAAVERLGMNLGHDIAQRLIAKKNKDHYLALAEFWNESGLGRMEVVGGDPVVLRLTKCYDCGVSKPGNPKASCRFKRSLLETALRESLGSPLRLDELECHRTGGTACVFEPKFA